MELQITQIIVSNITLIRIIFIMVPEPVTGTIVGILSKEALDRIAQRMDNTEQQIQNEIRSGNYEKAIELADDDRTTLQQLYDETINVLNQNKDQINNPDEKCARLKQERHQVLNQKRA